MNDVTNLRSTIVAKSDQMNAADLLGIRRTIVVTDVRLSGTEQPLIVHFEGDEGKPYKPGLSMRRVLVFAWGEDGTQWAGRAMTLYNEVTVKWGGEEVGGLRISHMSHIPSDLKVSLTMTRGSKKTHLIRKLNIPPLADVLAAIEKATNKAGMEAARALAEQLVARADIEEAREAYGAKVKALKGAKPAADKAPAVSILDALIARIESAADKDAAWSIVEEARKSVEDAEAQKLEAAFIQAWE